MLAVQWPGPSSVWESVEEIPSPPPPPDTTRHQSGKECGSGVVVGGCVGNKIPQPSSGLVFLGFIRPQSVIGEDKTLLARFEVKL